MNKYSYNYTVAQKHDPAKDFVIGFIVIALLFALFAIVGTMEARSEASKTLYNYDPTTNTKSPIYPDNSQQK